MSTEERNAWFKMLEPAQQRVTLAEEVLRYLDAGKINPVRGAYIHTPALQDYRGAGLQEVLEENHCEVCALGALLYARVVSFNQFEIQASLVYRSIYWDVVQTEMHHYFSYQQIALIEAAFEMRTLAAHADPGYSELDRDEECEAASMFQGRGPASFRLRAIMENIIANGGTFVVTK